MKELFVSFVLMAMLTSPGLSKTSPASTTAPPAESTTSLPESDAQVFTLPNGLTIIVEEDHSAPVASVQAWCATGSIHEGDWLGAGMSHILEHMLFKGTETRQRGEIDKRVQDLGGYINAYTSFDRTVYWIDIPSDGVSEAVEILADIMTNATLPEDEYIKEQEVIRREFAMGFDNPDRMSSQLMFRTVFSQSPYRHPVIGYLDVYNRLTRKDVLAYYKKRYVPNNIFFVVTGDVDAVKIKEQLEAFYADIPRKALEPVYVPLEPEQAGRRDAHEEFPTELTRLDLAWQIPSVTSPDMAALDVLSTVLGGGASSPLYREIREKKELAYSIAAGAYGLANEGAFVIRAVCDPDKREAVERESLAILDRIRKDGVTETELEKARKSLLASQLGALTTARGKASDLGSNWLLTQNLDFSRDYLNAINRITVADLQRVANTYLTRDQVSITSLNPVGSLEPKAEKKEHAANLGIKEFDLPNGLRLIVRENHRLPLVSMIAVFKGGVLAETPGNNGITRLMAHSLIKGTTNRSAEEIAHEIESVGGSISSDSGNNSFSVSVDVMKPDLALGMDILADVLENPTFPQAEVEREKAAQLAGIKAEEDQITSVARNLLRENLFGSHPYALRGSGSAEAVPKLTSEQVAEFHKKLAVAKNGVLSVFGDVDAGEIYELAKKTFGSLPSGQPALENIPKAPALSSGKTVSAERPKNQAVVMVGFPGVDLYDKDRPVMELIETACSDLGSRFFDRIREKLGLAYFVGSSQLIGPTPGMFVFYLGTDPAKVDQVRKEFKDEIAQLAAGGLTPEELARAKKKLLGAEAIRDQSDRTMAQVAALDELFGLGADYRSRRTQEIEAVTIEDTKRAVQKYLSGPGSVETIVAPPATNEPSEKAN